MALIAARCALAYNLTMPNLKLTLLHTNDLHGSVNGLSRASALAQVIRAECAAENQTCLWWDAGDVEEWTVLESAASQGAALWALLRVAGVDQATVGNGMLLTYGPGAVQQASAVFGKPVLLAGLTELATGQPSPYTTPYALYDLGGLTLGVIGLTVSIKEYQYLGFRVDDPAQVLEYWLPRVREAGADVIAVLSHNGSGRDKELAQRFGGAQIAWIVSAHDHEIYQQPLNVNGVLIVETGHRGSYLGRLDLELAPGRVVAAKGWLLPLREGVAPDPAIDEAWRQQQKAQSVGLDDVVATMQAPASLSYTTESQMGDLLADAIRARVQSDVAVIIPGHLRDGLPAGPIRRRDLLDVLGSPTHPVCARLTGQQIKTLLEIRTDPARMLRKPLPLRNKPEGLPAVSGLRVQLDPAAPFGKRILDLRRDSGEPLDPERVYTLASSYYEMHFGFLDMLGAPQPPDLKLVSGPLGVTLRDYLAQQSPVAPPSVGRITLR